MILDEWGQKCFYFFMTFAHAIFIKSPEPSSWAQYILLLRHSRELDPAPWKKHLKWRSDILKRIIEKEKSLRCEYCGLENLIPNIGDKGRHKRMATLDHVIPKHRGGTNALDNLVICCSVCNSNKADRLPTEKELTCRTISKILSTWSPPHHSTTSFQM